MRYAVVIEKADGNYSAYVPDLPGCVATGATIVGALCVVDREEGGREALETAGIPLHALFQRSEFSPRKSPA